MGHKSIPRLLCREVAEDEGAEVQDEDREEERSARDNVLDNHWTFPVHLATCVKRRTHGSLDDEAVRINNFEDRNDLWDAVMKFGKD